MEKMKYATIQDGKLDLTGIPMKYVKVFEISVTIDGRVPFIEALKQVLRFCCVDGNLDNTHELDNALMKGRLDQRDRDRLSSLEKKGSKLIPSDGTPLVALTHDVA